MRSESSATPADFAARGFQPRNLIDLLQWRAIHQPERVAYSFLQNGESEEQSLTYRELMRRSRTVAAWLQPLVANGDRVLLLYPPGLDYLAAFFGCLYAGAIAVPAYPPRRNRSILRLQAIVADAKATIALSTAAILARVSPLFAQNPYLEPLRWLSTDSIVGNDEDASEEHPVAGDDLAFLQYTSGSTGTPKGVMLTHQNLLHNASVVHYAGAHTSGDRYVSWLPTFHDMGFMVGILQPLYAGIPVTLMSPAAFLQRPLRWLQAISRYRATTSGGPNFAYDLCVRKISEEDRAGLDLSSWGVAFSGAEPIRAETLDKFAAAFETCGFRREAFYPCYGLAEATLMVSGGSKMMPPTIKKLEVGPLENNRIVTATASSEHTYSLVGCGPALLDQRITIVHPDSLKVCQPDEVGEIWVSGPSVAAGYWNRPEETEYTFGARLADTPEGPFLRTGDLGFWQDGELFVTGRLKDLIIIRGLNHYPQDIEFTVEGSHPALRRDCGAAFSVEISGEERLVVVQEVNHRHQLDVDAVIGDICQRVAEEHEIQVHAVVLIKQGSIPKTSSGKIQRHACRSGFLERSLAVVAEWRANIVSEDEATTAPDSRASAKSVETWLVSHVAARFGLSPDKVDIKQPLSRYGLDSIAAIELKHKIESTFGIVLPMTDFLQSPSITEVAAQAFNQFTKEPSSPVSIFAHAQEPSGEYPLSRGQQALWFLQQLAPEGAAYNLALVMRIGSDVDIPAFRHALQALLARHRSLRATFGAPQGAPVQRIHEDMELSFQEIDAFAWSHDRLHRTLVDESIRPFDLEVGPLLRVGLFTLSEDERILLFTVHHMVADFWSLAILMHELGIIYQAQVEGVPATLPPLALQYTDYISWQEEMLESSQGAQHWAYWEKHLAAELPVMNLPTDRPRPPVQTYRGASQTFNLDNQTTQALKAIGHAQGATLYMTLLAAFDVLLYRYTGQADILIGSPTAGRSWAALAGVVGYFVNPVVLRVSVTENLSFADFLRQVRQTVLAAFEHQDYPFNLLVERLQPERDPSRSPLFQVMFVFQKTHLFDERELASFALGESGSRMQIGGLTVESVALEQRTTQFDLTLMVTETDNGILASLEYNTDLFEAETITRLVSHLRRLLASIVDHPEQSISQLPLLSREEEHRLLVEWNRTHADTPATAACIHQLFERQVERTPDALALRYEQQQLTYRELNCRANQLAHYLRQMGVMPETRVGLVMERGVEAVVAVLGVLKAGGAYVPFEAGQPVERLQLMLADAGVAVLVTQRHERERLHMIPAQFVSLDTDWPSIAEQSAENPASSVEAGNLAYVIYTSGSTGKPKGVALEHRSALALIYWAKEVFTPEELSGVLASTSFSFDLSVFEIFVTLSWGGKVIMAENALHLPSLAAAHEVTLVNTVPSAMTELLRMGGLPSSVRTVNLAGEPLPHALAQQIYQQENVARLFNLYGPSEDTTYSTYSLVERDASAPPTIGRPIANTEVYLLDSQLQPVPIGVPGQLCLSGAGLARGYLNRPELTAEYFIPHPFSPREGDRLYKTGDLARYLPDGRISFLGRIDQQVKVRGYRIELGEIEAALRQHEGVREVVVIAREDVPGDKRLVGYVVAEPEQPVSISELHAGLKAKLPQYMLPAALVLLDEMPLTPNGKINRRALPTPVYAPQEFEDTAEAPRTPLEEMLADIEADVLKIERIGVHDNFFELGGHSLLAMQVISRVRETFEIELPLRSLFESPTVAELAENIEAAMKAGLGLEVPPIKCVSRDGGRLPLSFAQQRLWIVEQLEEGNSFYNSPAAIRMEGRLNVAALQQTFNEIIRRHEVLRTRFLTLEGEAVQVISEPQPFILPCVDLSELSEPELRLEAERLTLQESQRPFDLTRGALLRVLLLRLSQTDHILLFTTHHIISDGWSIGVLIREVAALYRAYSLGEESPLPELPIQYADFAAWQRDWLQGEVLKRQLTYWKSHLGGKLSLLELPTDRPREAAQSFHGARQTMLLSKTLTDGLRVLSRSEQATLFMTLLAAFQILLSRYTGQQDIIVGTPINGRTRKETEGLVGFFVNMLAMRTNLSGNPSFKKLLQHVREVALSAYAHQDVPFDKLVEELQPQRNESGTPVFQVAFGFNNSAAPPLELPELTLSVLPLDDKVVRYDLTLWLEEVAEGLSATWTYRAELFDAARIRRMHEHFEALLQSIVENPDARLLSLEILTEAEKKQRQTREKELEEAKFQRLVNVKRKVTKVDSA